MNKYFKTIEFSSVIYLQDSDIEIFYFDSMGHISIFSFQYK